MLHKPIVAVTMGDPAGIGAEVIVKALTHQTVKKSCNPLILGDWGVLARTQRRMKAALNLIRWQPGQPLLPLLNVSDGFVVCSLSSLAAQECRPGTPSRAGGHAAYRYIS